MQRMIGRVLLVIALSDIVVAKASMEGPELKLVVAIRAENGEFAATNTVVSVFSSGSIGLKENENGKWDYGQKQGNIVSVTLEGQGWRSESKPLDEAAQFPPALCDELNQIDLGEARPNLRLALPFGAKIKAINDLTADLSVLIYSHTATQARYVVRAALVRKTGRDRYSVVHDRLVSEAGSFCGLQQIGRNGDFFVEVDEPAASSDYLGLYFYSIAR